MSQKLFRVREPVEDGDISYTVKAKTASKAKSLVASYLCATLGGETSSYRDRLIATKIIDSKSLSLLLRNEKIIPL